jgi:uncharacterized protein YdcH (DUF465 family)
MNWKIVMLNTRLKKLEEEHAALNKRINGLESTGVFDDVTLEVLKKQKLHLRDEILKLKYNYESND